MMQFLLTVICFILIIPVLPLIAINRLARWRWLEDAIEWYLYHTIGWIVF